MVHKALGFGTCLPTQLHLLLLFYIHSILQSKCPFMVPHPCHAVHDSMPSCLSSVCLSTITIYVSHLPTGGASDSHLCDLYLVLPPSVPSNSKCVAVTGLHVCFLCYSMSSLKVRANPLNVSLVSGKQNMFWEGFMNKRGSKS